MDNAQRNRQFISDCIDGPGLAVFSVGFGACSVPGCDSEPGLTPWHYTVGRATVGDPEFVIVGLPPTAAVELANWAHRRWHVRPALTRRPVRWRGHLLRADPVPHAWVGTDLDRMGQWFGYYWAESGGAESGGQEPFPDVVQLVWADHYGRFPDHPRCDRFVVASQPLLAVDPISYPAPTAD